MDVINHTSTLCCTNKIGTIHVIVIVLNFKVDYPLEDNCLPKRSTKEKPWDITKLKAKIIKIVLGEKIVK